MSTPHATGRQGSPSAGRALRAGLHVLVALLLAVGMWQTVAESALTPGIAVAGGAFALWYAIGARLAGSAPRFRGAVWVAILAALWVALVLQSPAFAWLVFALFLLVLHVCSTIVGVVGVVALTAVASGVLVADGADPGGAILGPAIGAAVAVGVMWGYRTILAESAERGRLLGELEVAQADLVAVQDELATAQRESGALAERARLARDIHDTLAQGYSSILLLSRAGLAGNGADEALLRQIEATAAENLSEARRVVHALAPAGLEDAPLPGAVARLLTRIAAETGLEARLETTGDPRLATTAVDVAVLRLVQGALANVRQHARARHVVVSLAYEPTVLLVDVVDDGVGFDPAAVTPASDGGGFGLRAMRERIADLGGGLTVESSPEGTAIAAEIPLEGP